MPSWAVRRRHYDAQTPTRLDCESTLTMVDDFNANHLADYTFKKGFGYAVGYNPDAGRSALVFFPTGGTLHLIDERNPLPPTWTSLKVWVTGHWDGDTAGNAPHNTSYLVVGAVANINQWSEVMTPLSVSDNPGLAIMVMNPALVDLEIADGADGSIAQFPRDELAAFALGAHATPDGVVTSLLLPDSAPVTPFGRAGVTPSAGSGHTVSADAATRTALAARTLCPGFSVSMDYGGYLTSWGYEMSWLVDCGQSPPGAPDVAGNVRMGTRRR